jgi:hypothetical protein
MDDDERAEAAKRLARLDRQAAADAFRDIADDECVEDAVRLEAAENLAALDPRSAAEVLRGIREDRRSPRGRKPFAYAGPVPMPPMPPMPPVPPMPPQPR